ncbi:MAG: ABC transporter ATP-binding protein [Chloroflexi bacterium]|nr:MAG: ABC transporter ATP-binding protein [Chloroflexota bacterium]
MSCRSYASISFYHRRGGMLQRLAIAQALMTDPELLILDEPTSGLDPRSQWEIRQILAGLHKQGKTVLLCSHYLAEVEALCDAVGILRRGELILSGTVEDLLHSRDVVEIVLGHGHSADEVVARLEIAGQVIEAQGDISRLPLIPMTTCFNFGAVGSIDWAGLVALLVVVVYVVALTRLGEYWLWRRDLLLQ